MPDYLDGKLVEEDFLKDKLYKPKINDKIMLFGYSSNSKLKVKFGKFTRLTISNEYRYCDLYESNFKNSSDFEGAPIYNDNGESILYIRI